MRKPKLTRTHCKRGHELTPENITILYEHDRPYNCCKACERIRKRAWYERKQLRENAGKLSEQLMEAGRRMGIVPPEDPERYFTKDDDKPAVTGPRIGDYMRHKEERP